MQHQSRISFLSFSLPFVVVAVTVVLLGCYQNVRKLEKYKKGGFHKAIAADLMGNSGQSWGASTVEEAKRRAIEECEKAWKTPCKIIEIDEMPYDEDVAREGPTTKEPINIADINTEISTQKSSQLGIVNVTYEVVNLYSEPRFDAIAVDTVSPSSNLKAISETDYWVEVETSQGQKGWIAKSWIKDSDYSESVADVKVAMIKTVTESSQEVDRDGQFIAYATGVVYDKNTNLEWYAGPDRATNWGEAKKWVESLNVAGGEWRMPTLKELKTMYKKGAGTGKRTPLLGTTYRHWVWSGETNGPSQAWILIFGNGGSYEGFNSRDVPAYSFAVRSRKQKPFDKTPKYASISPEVTEPKIIEDGNFVKFATGVVYDKNTDLEWYAGPDEKTLWWHGAKWIESLNAAGNGWRMPTIKELKTLYKRGAGRRNMTPLLKTTGWWVWAEKRNSTTAYGFDFQSGTESWYDATSFYKFSARCFAVRSQGQEPVDETPEYASINPEVTEPNQIISKDTSPKKEEHKEKIIPLISKDINFGPYHALIIGNNNYRSLPNLITAKSDAEKIANILKNNYNFKVQLIMDAKRADILLALNKLRRTLSKKDNLLIYYAGHGWLDEEAGEGYWLPIDAEKDNEIHWVSNSYITKTLKATPAKHILIIADSCYSGTLARGIHIKRKTTDYYARISKKRARSVLSSGGLEPVIDSGGYEGHSVFASAFIDALIENDGILDGTQLFSIIRRPVMLNSDQTPEYADIRKAGHAGGDFLFVRQKR